MESLRLTPLNELSGLRKVLSRKILVCHGVVYYLALTKLSIEEVKDLPILTML